MPLCANVAIEDGDEGNDDFPDEGGDDGLPDG